MNWDALGALAEFVGAVGVIGSLLYLARQVRTSNRAAAVQARLESTRLPTDFMDPLIERPALDQLMLKGRKGLDSLSPDEYVQFSNMRLKAFWFFSAGHFSSAGVRSLRTTGSKFEQSFITGSVDEVAWTGGESLAGSCTAKSLLHSSILN